MLQEPVFSISPSPVASSFPLFTSFNCFFWAHFGTLSFVSTRPLLMFQLSGVSMQTASIKHVYDDAYGNTPIPRAYYTLYFFFLPTSEKRKQSRPSVLLRAVVACARVTSGLLVLLGSSAPSRFRSPARYPPSAPL